MSGRANGRNSLKKKTSNNTSNKLSLGNGLNINYVLMGVVGILVVTLIVKECQQKKEQFTEDAVPCKQKENLQCVKGKFRLNPVLGYNAFQKEQRPLIKKSDPTMALKDVNSKLGSLWKALSTEEKAAYDTTELNLITFISLIQSRFNTHIRNIIGISPQKTTYTRIDWGKTKIDIDDIREGNGKKKNYTKIDHNISRIIIGADAVYNGENGEFTMRDNYKYWSTTEYIDGENSKADYSDISLETIINKVNLTQDSDYKLKCYIDKYKIAIDAYKEFYEDKKINNTYFDYNDLFSSEEIIRYNVLKEEGNLRKFNNNIAAVYINNYDLLNIKMKSVIDAYNNIITFILENCEDKDIIKKIHPSGNDSSGNPIYDKKTYVIGIIAILFGLVAFAGICYKQGVFKKVKTALLPTESTV